MQKPRLTFLTQYFPPESLSAANRTGAMADAFHKAFDLTVYAPRPGYPKPSFYAADAAERHDGGVPYATVRTEAFHPHEGGFVRRALRELGMSSRLAWRARTEPTDMVVSTCPSLFLLHTGWALAKRKGVPWIADIRDVTWVYALESKRVGRLGKVAGVQLEKQCMWLLSQADLVVTVTDWIHRYFLDWGLPDAKIRMAPNGIARALVEAYDAGKDAAAKTAGPTRVLYAGSIGYKEGLDLLLEAAKRFRPDEVEFVLAGDGPERQELQDKAEREGLSHVRFPGYLDRPRLIEETLASDVCVATLLVSPSHTGAIPTKFYDYMAAGKPILFAGEGEGRVLLDRARCGETVPREVDRIVAGLRRLVDDPELRRRWGAAGRTFVETEDQREEIMDDFTEELLRRVRR